MRYGVTCQYNLIATKHIQHLKPFHTHEPFGLDTIYPRPSTAFPFSSRSKPPPPQTESNSARPQHGAKISFETTDSPPSSS